MPSFVVNSCKSEKEQLRPGHNTKRYEGIGDWTVQMEKIVASLAFTSSVMASDAEAWNYLISEAFGTSLTDNSAYYWKKIPIKAS